MYKPFITGALAAVVAAGLVACSSSGTVWGALQTAGSPIKYGDAYTLCDTYKGEWGKPLDLGYMTNAQRVEAHRIISQHEDCQSE